MTNDKPDIKLYPTTRYQGSKRKLLPWLYEIITELETKRGFHFETVLDAFGGSASVSYMFKKMKKSVTYNDKLHFNYLIGKALIENNTTILTEEDIVYLTSHHEFIEYDDFIQKNFKDIFYLDHENVWLDMVVNNIIYMEYDKKTLPYKKSLAYYALFQASLMKRPFNLFHRRNLSIRTNEVERSFGNKTTWEKSFHELFIRFCHEANTLRFDNGSKCQALNLSVFEIESRNYDLVYVDPPYIRGNSSNETSNYLRCYHFLEGLSLYRNWGERINFDTPNLRFIEPDSNEFSSEKIYETFERIIYQFRHSTIIISYKKYGTPSIQHIVKILQKYKDTVYTRTMHYKYALSRQNGNTKKNREVLIIGI